MKNRSHCLLALSLAAVSGALLPAASITLPVEQLRLVPSPLPGYQLAMELCVTCHSAEYVAFQPTSSRAYWQAATVKMQKTFGAPIPDAAVAPLVDYLVRTYGAERGTTPAGGSAAGAAATPANRAR
jgi:hypothetical protein